MLDALAQRLGANRSRWSCPGHGQGSAITPIRPSYADLAGSAAESTLPSQPFDAVGYSLGGKLLLELAIRLPGRIGRMVLGGVGDNVFAPETVAAAAAAALEKGPDLATRRPPCWRSCRPGRPRLQ